MKIIKAMVLIHRADGTHDELRFSTEAEAKKRFGELQAMAGRGQRHLGRKIQAVSWTPIAQRVGRGSWA